MARGGRRKVSIYERRDRANKRFIKKVSKAVLPSKRTQRKLLKACFSMPSSSYRSGPRAKLKQPPAKWKDIKPSRKQWIGCLAVASVCTYPVFANGNFDGSSAAFAVLFFFFSIPFLTAVLVVLNRNRAHPNQKTDELPANNLTFVESPTGDYEVAEINAPLYMAQFKDSLQIMQSTADSSTFFSRFDFAKEKLVSMAEYEKLGIKFNESPTFILDQLQDENNLADTINVLIDNSYKKQIQKVTSLKTERGRSNSNQKWYASFEPYFDRMPIRSKTYLDLKLAALQEV